MSKNKTIEIVDDIFGVTSDGGNIFVEKREGSFFDDSADGTFDEKAEDVSQKVSESTLPSNIEESVVEKEEIVEETQEETSEQEVFHARPEPSQDYESVLKDSIPSAEIEEQGIAEMEVKKNDTVTPAVEQECEEKNSLEVPSEPVIDDEEETEIVEPTDVEKRLEDEGWKITCPSPMWEEFYKHKVQSLEQYVMGREIPFRAFYTEIKKAHVNIKVSLSDHRNIASKMQEIQGCRDRVVQIRTQICSQHFLWKRLIPLFEGLVAMVQYEKPAAKQEGVIYNRMHDMIEYQSKLEMMYESTKDVISNLDAAYDSLSRQVTMSMPQKTIERFENNEPQSSVSNPNLSDFDTLQDNSKKGVKESSSNDEKTTIIEKKSTTGKPEEIDW